MDMSEADKKPKNDRDNTTQSEGKLWGDALKPLTPDVTVSLSEQELLASGDQPTTPVISPAASPRISATQQKQSGAISTSDNNLAAGDNPVSATASLTTEPGKDDEQPVTVSVSADPVLPTPISVNMSVSVTGDMPQTVPPHGDVEAQEAKSQGGLNTDQFFPDIEASESQERTGSASNTDSFTRDDTFRSDAVPLDKTRSDNTLGGASAEGPSTSGWTTDSEDGVSNKLVSFLGSLIISAEREARHYHNNYCELNKQMDKQPLTHPHTNTLTCACSQMRMHDASTMHAHTCTRAHL